MTRAERTAARELHPNAPRETPLLVIESDVPTGERLAAWARAPARPRRRFWRPSR